MTLQYRVEPGIDVPLRPVNGHSLERVNEIRIERRLQPITNAQAAEIHKIAEDFVSKFGPLKDLANIPKCRRMNKRLRKMRSRIERRLNTHNSVKPDAERTK